jgi:hypothetical protein
MAIRRGFMMSLVTCGAGACDARGFGRAAIRKQPGSMTMSAATI